MDGELRYDVPLAGYTSWRVGGPAKRMFQPENKANLLAFLATLPSEEPILWLGHGSNVLVRDGGFPGTVILFREALGNIECSGANSIKVQAGVGCAKLARFAAKSGLTGTEFLAGIPGTIGGALALNAGAHGREIWQIVTEVVTVNHAGSTHVRTPNDYCIGYRDVRGIDGEWFLEATLVLELGPVDVAQEGIRECLQRRSSTQPIGMPSAGSTFRNPPGDYAGRLIEAAGLKGIRQGGAEISVKHANFILNSGNATATDIETLMQQIQAEVKRRFGVELVPEVRIVGV